MKEDKQKVRVSFPESRWVWVGDVCGRRETWPIADEHVLLPLDQNIRMQYDRGSLSTCLCLCFLVEPFKRTSLVKQNIM